MPRGGWVELITLLEKIVASRFAVTDADAGI